MASCQGTLSDGKPCPKIVKSGQTYCHWHNPEDESWREQYERLERSTPQEKTDIVLRLIDDHPEHKLMLPKRGGQRGNLTKIDLGWETIDKKRKKSRVEAPSWWYIRGWNGSKGANLARANLQNGDLRLANLQYANLVFANFQGADLRLANLRGADLRLTDLRGADLRNANLQNANLGEANLIGADLSLADLRGADLRNANLQNANLAEAKLQGVDLSNIINMSDVYLSGAWLDRTRLKRDHFGDGIPEEREGNYAAARRTYTALKKNFNDLGDYDSARWAYRKEKRMEKLEARQRGQSGRSNRQWRDASAGYFKYYNDTLVEWLCDYGESPWRVTGWMAALLFILGPLLFSSMDGVLWNEKLVQQYYELSSGWQQFWFSYHQYFLYTVNVVTTANFSGLQPISAVAKLTSGLLAIIGIALAGLSGFIIGQRLRHS